MRGQAARLSSTQAERAVFRSQHAPRGQVGVFSRAKRAAARPLRGSFFFFSSRRRHTRFDCDWSSDVCSSDLFKALALIDVGQALVLAISMIGLAVAGFRYWTLVCGGVLGALISTGAVLRLRQIGRGACRGRV